MVDPHKHELAVCSRLYWWKSHPWLYQEHGWIVVLFCLVLVSPHLNHCSPFESHVKRMLINWAGSVGGLSAWPGLASYSLRRRWAY